MVSEKGIYQTANGEVFKVQESKTNPGKFYAKRLQACSGQRLTEAETRVQFEFVYAPGAVYALAPEQRMSLDEAKQWGVRTGSCCVCGAYLKDAKSVSLGIGPVCIKKTAWNNRQEVAA